MKYFFLILLISFSFWIEKNFFTYDQLFSSVVIGAVSGIIWEGCKVICAKYEEGAINSLLIWGIFVLALLVSVAFAFFNYELGAKSALLSLYSGFLVSEIWAYYESKAQENNEQQG